MDTFAALADPVRRDLLLRLAAGSARVVDLAAGHPISRPAISRHLRVLGDAGLVAAEVRGRERHYRLVPAALHPVDAFVATLARLSREHPAAAARPAAPAPPVDPALLDGLDLEVRRAVRDRRIRPTTTEETG